METNKTVELEIHSYELMKASFLFEAVIDPVRQRLLCLFEEERRLTKAMICERLGIDKTLCIQHLSILCGVGLLIRQTENGQVLYAANEEKLEQLYVAAEALIL